MQQRYIKILTNIAIMKASYFSEMLKFIHISNCIIFQCLFGAKLMFLTKEGGYFSVKKLKFKQIKNELEISKTLYLGSNVNICICHRVLAEDTLKI